jgi:hypothetical protein
VQLIELSHHAISCLSIIPKIPSHSLKEIAVYCRKLWKELGNFLTKELDGILKDPVQEVLPG